MKFWNLVLVAALAMAGVDAEAKRLGGGKSVGKQSGNVTQREAAPASPGGAVQNAAKPATPVAPSAPVPAAAPKKPWGAMLGGLAAGVGLAWLAHSLGMGEAFGNILMFGLLALGVMMVFGWFMRSRAAGRPATAGGSPLAFEGVAAGGAGANSPAPSGAPILTPAQYSPRNVGNDASARPWERSGAVPLDGSGSMIGSALMPAQGWIVPADFDSENFLTAAKHNFVALQAAWDKSDIGGLRAMMTDEMLHEIQTQLAERESHTGGPGNHTEVVMLDAKLLGIEDLGRDYLASVEYSGMIKEDPASGPSPFREVWNMTKPKAGGGWLVAGVQALQ
jgi:predicted lipid-binding transport protein (Tim44 family)